jgi:hypothetical protein
MPHTKTKVSAAIGAALIMAATATPVRAQAFADVKTALVDYSKSDMEPRKACETLGSFKSKEIAQIAAASIEAAAGVPALPGNRV